ncbi:peripheral-type benzodiazepine receptor, putative [Ixodes scapularis]|uniref:Peripheral-type benzodiazepine receptor, putative n=1 Tax=Ixodes scapularis TaxID=6945 RepID=B7QH17_IXOSC|nr:peripheral-type benzodiazepine receptor, putative [Ixodes scapularis]|eukprot:XP_002414474.1 peripheral-type benzodiazepine receptor, putative [Ixodes scapularis]
MHLQLKRCALPVVMTLLPSVGGCVGAVYLRREYRFWYQNLRKPSWCAKHWHFFPTYNVLYPAMGLGSYLVVKEHGFEGPARTALVLYAAQLGLTWLWVPIMFKRRCFGLAFVDSVAVTCLSGATLWAFRPLSDTAAALLFPSFLWSAYLMLTSFFVLRRNRSDHSPH